MNFRNFIYGSPIGVAFDSRLADLFELFLEEGVKLENPDRYLDAITSSKFADNESRRNAVKLVELLISRGANPNYESPNYKEIVKIEVGEEFPEFSKMPMRLALMNGQEDVAYALLKSGAKVEHCKEFLETFIRHKESGNGDSAAALSLIQHLAEGRDDLEGSLKAAIKKNRLDWVVALIDSGAQVTQEMVDLAEEEFSFLAPFRGMLPQQRKELKQRRSQMEAIVLKLEKALSA